LNQLSSGSDKGDAVELHGRNEANLTRFMNGNGGTR